MESKDNIQDEPDETNELDEVDDKDDGKEENQGRPLDERFWMCKTWSTTYWHKIYTTLSEISQYFGKVPPRKINDLAGLQSEELKYIKIKPALTVQQYHDYFKLQRTDLHYPELKLHPKYRLLILKKLHPIICKNILDIKYADNKVLDSITKYYVEFNAKSDYFLAVTAWNKSVKKLPLTYYDPLQNENVTDPAVINFVALQSLIQTYKRFKHKAFMQMKIMKKMRSETKESLVYLFKKWWIRVDSIDNLLDKRSRLYPFTYDFHVIATEKSPYFKQHFGIEIQISGSYIGRAYFASEDGRMLTHLGRVDKFYHRLPAMSISDALSVDMDGIIAILLYDINYYKDKSDYTGLGKYINGTNIIMSFRRYIHNSISQMKEYAKAAETEQIYKQVNNFRNECIIILNVEKIVDMCKVIITNVYDYCVYKQLVDVNKNTNLSDNQKLVEVCNLCFDGAGKCKINENGCAGLYQDNTQRKRHTKRAAVLKVLINAVALNCMDLVLSQSSESETQELTLSQQLSKVNKLLKQ
eukprot:478055_1